MTRRMLINGCHAEELRVAVVDDNTLESYQVEVAASGQERGNIYRGVVKSLAPSLNAAFVEYGAEKHGFLALNDVVPAAYHRPLTNGEELRVDRVLRRRKPLTVQVTKDAMGSKGAALTTNVSLPGRYLVLTPFDPSRGVSRKVEDEKLRRKLRDKVRTLELPEGAGYIIRTNAVDQTKTALKADVTALKRLWQQVRAAADEGTGAELLYDDQDLIVRALRDYLDASIAEVLIDDAQLVEQAKRYIEATMPRAKFELTHYVDRLPLFYRFNIEPQITAIQLRKVALPSGGSIVIDPTEALTAIDVNSGKSTGAGTQGETAFSTNIEAAAEIGKQLRLRDIGGLVVVDFIDMRTRKQNGEVEKALKAAMKVDKARSRVGRISSNGLLEINRQRIAQALHLRTHRSCPACGGVGRLPSAELMGLDLLRRIEARAATGRLKRVDVALHPEVAHRLQNQRRRQLVALEERHRVEVAITADPALGPAAERVAWINHTTEEDSSRRRQTAKATASARTEPPASEEQTSEQREPSPESGTSRKRRSRRSRRRRQAQDAPAADGAEAPDAQAEDSVAEGAAPAAAEGSSGRRKRPRRRRGRRKQEADAPETEAAADADRTKAAPPDAPAKRKPRRRGRRGRGKRATADAAGAQDAGVKDTDGGGGDASAGDGGAAAGAPAAEGAKRKRPRRRRGRRGAARSSAEGEGEGE